MFQSLGKYSSLTFSKPGYNDGPYILIFVESLEQVWSFICQLNTINKPYPLSFCKSEDIYSRPGAKYFEKYLSKVQAHQTNT